MTEQRDKVFEFAPLSDYSLKERIMIRLADLVFFFSVKTLGSLTRFDVRGIDHFDEIEAAGKLPIYTFWHDRILLGTYFSGTAASSS